MKAPLSIQTNKSVSECVTLLQSATTADTFVARLSADSGAIMCQVSGNKFRLWQKRSFSNSFKPFFYGTLEPGPIGTRLTGHFRMHLFVIAFMAVWFGGLVLMGGTIIVQSFRTLPAGHNHPIPVAAVFAPLLMMLFGVGLLSFGKWLGRSEESSIADFLQQTFSAQAKTSSASIEQPAQSQKPLTGALFFFAGMALLCFVGSISGISSVHTSSVNGSPPQTVITHFQGTTGRAISFSLGLLLAFLAYGTWKRLFIAWLLVFALIVLSGANFVYDILSDPNDLPPPQGVPFAAFCAAIFAGAAAVTGYWAFWWFKKKAFFTE